MSAFNSEEQISEDQTAEDKTSHPQSSEGQCSKDSCPSLPEARSYGADSGANLDILTAFNLMRTTAALSPYLDSALRDINLTSAQLNVLLALRDAPNNGLALSEIGRHLVVTRGNITGLVDRLERDGLVVRGASHDRRVTVATLTPKASELIEQAAPRRQHALEDLLATVTPEEKQSLISVLTRIRRRLRESINK